MLTKLVVRNFKRFGYAEIELGNPVVFIGPNNSGKTSALQALALWEAGLKRWNEKRSGKKTAPAKRPGVTINRKDLITVPVPDANLLWRGLHVRELKEMGVLRMFVSTLSWKGSRMARTGSVDLSLITQMKSHFTAVH